MWVLAPLQGLGLKFKMNTMMRLLNCSSRVCGMVLVGVGIPGPFFLLSHVDTTGKPQVDAKLQELVQPDCSLTSLSFSGIKLGPEGAQAIASVLKVVVTVAQIHCCQTCFARQVSPPCKQVCTSLRELNLSHCAIGGRGAIVLAQALTQDTCIQKLALAGNGLVRGLIEHMHVCCFILAAFRERKGEPPLP